MYMALLSEQHIGNYKMYEIISGEDGLCQCFYIPKWAPPQKVCGNYAPGDKVHEWNFLL
jgi:hypothetical protein